MEGHAVARPEGDECPELVAELRDGADEGAARLQGCALGDVEVGGDVDAPETEPCDEPAEEEDRVGVRDDLDEA